MTGPGPEAGRLFSQVGRQSQRAGLRFFILRLAGYKEGVGPKRGAFKAGVSLPSPRDNEVLGAGIPGEGEPEDGEDPALPFPMPPGAPRIWAFLCGPSRPSVGPAQGRLPCLAMQHFCALTPPDGRPVCRDRALRIVPTRRALSNMMPTCLVFSALLPNSPRDDIRRPGG